MSGYRTVWVDRNGFFQDTEPTRAQIGFYGPWVQHELVPVQAPEPLAEWEIELLEAEEDAQALAKILVDAVEAGHPNGVVWPEGSAIAFAHRLLATGRLSVTS